MDKGDSKDKYCELCEGKLDKPCRDHAVKIKHYSVNKIVDGMIISSGRSLPDYQARLLPVGIIERLLCGYDTLSGNRLEDICNHISGDERDWLLAQMGEPNAIDRLNARADKLLKSDRKIPRAVRDYIIDQLKPKAKKKAKVHGTKTKSLELFKLKVQAWSLMKVNSLDGKPAHNQYADGANVSVAKHLSGYAGVNITPRKAQEYFTEVESLLKQANIKAKI